MYRRRKPRALTLTLPNAKQPFFMMNGKRYTLRNLSQGGLGLWVKAPAPFGLVPGAQLSGDVVIGNEIFSVGLEIRHIASNFVGFKFVNAPPELTKIFKELLEPSHYASSLLPHPESGSDDVEMQASRLWYASEDGNTELVVWYNEMSKMIQAVQIRWLGRLVFRQLHEMTVTGYIKDEAKPKAGLKVLPQDLLVTHSPADIEIVHQAAQFLTSVPPPLPGAVLWQFLELGEQVYLPESVFEKFQVA